MAKSKARRRTKARVRAKRKRALKRKFVRRWHSPAATGESAKKVFISGADLRSLVVDQLRNKLDGNFGFYISDDKFYCPPLKDAKEIIKKSALDRKKWVAEKFDCDDFAQVLKAHFAEAAYKNGQRRRAHCFGMVWGSLPGPHAINWMVTADKKLRFIEPQDDTIYIPRATDKGIYFMLV